MNNMNPSLNQFDDVLNEQNYVRSNDLKLIIDSLVSSNVNLENVKTELNTLIADHKVIELNRIHERLESLDQPTQDEIDRQLALIDVINVNNENWKDKIYKFKQTYTEVIEDSFKKYRIAHNLVTQANIDPNIDSLKDMIELQYLALGASVSHMFTIEKVDTDVDIDILLNIENTSQIVTIKVDGRNKLIPSVMNKLDMTLIPNMFIQVVNTDTQIKIYVYNYGPDLKVTLNPSNNEIEHSYASVNSKLINIAVIVRTGTITYLNNNYIGTDQILPTYLNNDIYDNIVINTVNDFLSLKLLEDMITFKTNPFESSEVIDKNKLMKIEFLPDTELPFGDTLGSNMLVNTQDSSRLFQINLNPLFHSCLPNGVYKMKCDMYINDKLELGTISDNGLLDKLHILDNGVIFERYGKTPLLFTDNLAVLVDEDLPFLFNEDISTDQFTYANNDKYLNLTGFELYVEYDNEISNETFYEYNVESSLLQVNPEQKLGSVYDVVKDAYGYRNELNNIYLNAGIMMEIKGDCSFSIDNKELIIQSDRFTFDGHEVMVNTVDTLFYLEQAKSTFSIIVDDVIVDSNILDMQGKQLLITSGDTNIRQIVTDVTGINALQKNVDYINSYVIYNLDMTYMNQNLYHVKDYKLVTGQIMKSYNTWVLNTMQDNILTIDLNYRKNSHQIQFALEYELEDINGDKLHLKPSSVTLYAGLDSLVLDDEVKFTIVNDFNILVINNDHVYDEDIITKIKFEFPIEVKTINLVEFQYSPLNYFDCYDVVVNEQMIVDLPIQPYSLRIPFKTFNPINGLKKLLLSPEDTFIADPDYHKCCVYLQGSDLCNYDGNIYSNVDINNLEVIATSSGGIGSDIMTASKITFPARFTKVKISKLHNSLISEFVIMDTEPKSIIRFSTQEQYRIGGFNGK